MVLANRITALIVLALGVATAINSTSYQIMAEFGPGPGFWPAVLSVALIALAALWFYQSGNSPSKGPFFASLWDGGRVLTIIAIFLTYLLLLDRFGFVPSTVLFLMVVLWLFERRGIINSAIVSLVIPIGLSLLFDTFLKVGLPGGPFTP